MATVGVGEYNAGHASLSRSITRLWRRGLVVIWKNLTNSATGISLTEAGEALAQAISEEETEDANKG
jgi:DNA-binding MarR family transcriptional regulator